MTMPAEVQRFNNGSVSIWPLSKARHCQSNGMEAGLVNLLSGLSRARLGCQTLGLSVPPPYRDKSYRFPAEIISHGVWLYYRFYLGYRNMENPCSAAV